jgi:hypothetical protein
VNPGNQNDVEPPPLIDACGVGQDLASWHPCASSALLLTINHAPNQIPFVAHKSAHLRAVVPCVVPRAIPPGDRAVHPTAGRSGRTGADGGDEFDVYHRGDGKVLVLDAGARSLFQYLPDGAPDPSFGADGIATDSSLFAATRIVRRAAGDWLLTANGRTIVEVDASGSPRRLFQSLADGFSVTSFHEIPGGGYVLGGSRQGGSGLNTAFRPAAAPLPARGRAGLAGPGHLLRCRRVRYTSPPVDGTGGFDTRVQINFDLGFTPRDFEVTDVNADGRPDIVIANGANRKGLRRCIYVDNPSHK